MTYNSVKNFEYIIVKNFQHFVTFFVFFELNFPYYLFIFSTKRWIEFLSFCSYGQRLLQRLSLRRTDLFIENFVHFGENGSTFGRFQVPKKIREFAVYKMSVAINSATQQRLIDFDDIFFQFENSNSISEFDNSISAMFHFIKSQNESRFSNKKRASCLEGKICQERDEQTID